MLPDVDTDFLHISEAERAELIRSFPSTTEFLKDAFHIRAAGERVVKGSAGIPFPRADEDPPMHKYAAIFDRRPCFDGLRSSFFWPTCAGAERRCHYMFEALDRAHDLDPGARVAGGELAAALLAAQEQSNSRVLMQKRYLYKFFCMISSFAKSFLNSKPNGRQP